MTGPFNYVLYCCTSTFVILFLHVYKLYQWLKIYILSLLKFETMISVL